MSYYEHSKTEEYILNLLDEKIEPRLNDVKKEALTDGIPIIPDSSAQFLLQLLSLKKPKRILEIGTAVGYSGALMLLNSSAVLYTIDFNEKSLEKAKNNFEKLGLNKRAHIYLGDASDIVPMLEGEFDFIFLDGPKGRYHEFLPYLINLMPSGGVLLADNVLYSGRMSGETLVPQEKQTIYDRLEKYIHNVSNDDRLITSIMQIGDGMSLSIKK